MLTLSVFLSLLALVAASPLDPRQAAPAITSVTPAQWAALNTSVGGRLALGYPMGRPCFALATAGTNGNLDAGQCLAAQNGWKNDTYINTQFGGYMQTNWGTCQKTAAECQLDFTAPQNPVAYSPPMQCAQGSVSNYYINVQQPSDVAAALNFSQTTKVPLVIKNSGHDYKGRSSGPNSLGLWVHNLQSGPTFSQSFVPEGCSGIPGIPAITHGSGHPFINLYQFADAHNVTYVGGSSETVVAGGGWVSGGGHSALSNTLGLGVDRALQLRVVLANGSYVTANACKNQELFYALRGSGGGVFGVAMEMTSAVAPRLTLQVAYIRFVSLNLQSAARFLALCIQNGLVWSQQGWGGYIEPGAMTAQASGFVLTTPSLTTAQAVAAMKPLTDFAASLGNVALNNSVTQVSSFYEFYQNFIQPNEEVVGIGTALGSHLIPKSQFANNATQTQLLVQMAKAYAAVGNNVLPATSPGLVYGGAPLQILVTAPSSYNAATQSKLMQSPHSAQPLWYSTVWHVIAAPTFNYAASAATIKQAFQKAHAAAQALEALPIQPAAYQNEADTYQDNAPAAFWGTTNYNNLMALKPKYDPQNLLTCWNCIGWNSADARYSCYPGI